MAQLAVVNQRNDASKRREVPPFRAIQPLVGADDGKSLLATLSRIGDDLRSRVKGVAKAVRAPERELLGTPLPPEAITAAYGPLFFKTRS
jgi:hypothetical protein